MFDRGLGFHFTVWYCNVSFFFLCGFFCTSVCSLIVFYSNMCWYPRQYYQSINQIYFCIAQNHKLQFVSGGFTICTDVTSSVLRPSHRVSKNLKNLNRWKESGKNRKLLREPQRINGTNRGCLRSCLCRAAVWSPEPWHSPEFYSKGSQRASDGSLQSLKRKIDYLHKSEILLYFPVKDPKHVKLQTVLHKIICIILIILSQVIPTKPGYLLENCLCVCVCVCCTYMRARHVLGVVGVMFFEALSQCLHSGQYGLSGISGARPSVIERHRN